MLAETKITASNNKVTFEPQKMASKPEETKIKIVSPKEMGLTEKVEA